MQANVKSYWYGLAGGTNEMVMRDGSDRSTALNNHLWRRRAVLVLPCRSAPVSIGSLSRSTLYFTRAIGLPRTHAFVSFVLDKVKVFPNLCMHPACADMMVSGGDLVDERILDSWARSNDWFNDTIWDTYNLDMYAAVFPAFKKLT